MTQRTHLALLHEWRRYPSQITRIVSSSTGQRVAFGGVDGSIECWERTGDAWQCLFALKEAELPQFALSPDGERLAVATPDRTQVVVYQVGSGHLTRCSLPYGRVEVMAFSPRGELTVGDQTGWVYVWDTVQPPGSESPCKASYTAGIPYGSECAIKALAWSPDGEVLISSEQGNWYVCSYLYHEAACTNNLFGGHEGLFVQAIAWRPDSKRLAIAYGSQVERVDNLALSSIKIWSRRSRTKPLVICQGTHAGRIITLAWSPDGQRLLSLDEAGVLCAWDARSGQLMARLADDGGFCSLGVGAGGQVFLGRRNCTVQLYEALVIVGYRVSGEEARELTCPEAWTYVQCRTCLSGGDLREQQEYSEVRPIYRLEAGDLVCVDCHTYLANGRPAPTGHPFRDCFRIHLDGLRAELDVDGWVYGGCWIAALGLLRWIQASTPCALARLMVIEGTREQGAGLILDHVVVELLVDGASYCLDPDGASPTGVFLWEWSLVHGLNGCHLVPLDEQRLREATDIPYRPEASERVAQTLQETVGPWRDELLAMLSRQAAR